MYQEDNDLRKIPVVVLKTSGAENAIEAAYGNYVNSYLVKPIGFDDFQRLMKDLGFYWLGWNTNPYPETEQP